jgi:hypothetical protein
MLFNSAGEDVMARLPSLIYRPLIKSPDSALRPGSVQTGQRSSPSFLVIGHDMC